MFRSKTPEINLKTQNEEIRMETGDGKEISYCQSGSGLAWQPHKNPFRLGHMLLTVLQSGSMLPAFLLFSESWKPTADVLRDRSFHLEEVWLGSSFGTLPLFDQRMMPRFCAQWTSLVRFPVSLHQYSELLEHVRLSLISGLTEKRHLHILIILYVRC